jgi:hypothetical protein
MPFDPCILQGSAQHLDFPRLQVNCRRLAAFPGVHYPLEEDKSHLRSSGGLDPKISIYSLATAPSVDFFGRPSGVRPGKIENETAIAATQFHLHLYQALFSFHRIFVFRLSHAFTFVPVDNFVKYAYFLSELLTCGQYP